MTFNPINDFPTLISHRLMFVEQTQEYQHDILKMLSDKEVTQYYDLHLISETDSIKLINADAKKYTKGESIRWVIKSLEDNQFIGSCGINRFDNGSFSAVISYELIKAEWGKGYATEIVSRLSDFIFSNDCPKNINKIEAYVMQSNVASEKVLNKVGFSKDGILREHGFWKGQFHDLSLFSFLRSEHQKNKDDLCTKVA